MRLYNLADDEVEHIANVRHLSPTHYRMILQLATDLALAQRPEPALEPYLKPLLVAV